MSDPRNEKLTNAAAAASTAAANLQAAAAAAAGAPADDQPHRPADDREVVYYEGSPQLRGELGMMAIWVVGSVLLFAGGIYAFVKIQDGWMIGLPACLVAIGIIFLPALLMRRHKYRITNYRIDVEFGLIGKKIDTLELWHVEDIHYEQSITDRMLNVGTITVISHDDTTPRLELKSLPDPRPIFESLKQRVIAVKRQRGVIKMDVG